MQPQITYRQILEGIIKFNIVFFITALGMFYFKTMSIQNYYELMGTQLIIVITTIFFAKCHDVLTSRNHFKDYSVKRRSIYFGFVYAMIFLYLGGLVLGYFTWSLNLAHIIFNELVFGAIYWMIICYLVQLPFFSSIIHFLGNGFSYKQILYIFIILSWYMLNIWVHTKFIVKLITFMDSIGINISYQRIIE